MQAVVLECSFTLRTRVPVDPRSSRMTAVVTPPRIAFKRRQIPDRVRKVTEQNEPRPPLLGQQRHRTVLALP